MGNTDWGDVIGTGITVAGGLIGADQASSAADKASQNYTQDALKLAQLQNEWTRANQAWARDQNREITNENFLRNLGALKYNRPEQVSQFGSTRWEEADDGTIRQITDVDASVQPTLDALRGKYGEGVATNSAVMGAIRDLQASGIQEAEAAQRARYAAMGIPIQSTAMDRGERQLGDARNRADLDAILAGNQAWQTGQANLRSNLGTLSDLETGIQNRSMAQPGFTQLGVPLQGQVGGVSAPSLGNVAGTASNVGNLAGQATGSAWQSAAGGLGDVASDIWRGL
jgi:hypothetical protein